MFAMIRGIFWFNQFFFLLRTICVKYVQWASTLNIWKPDIAAINGTVTNYVIMNKIQRYYGYPNLSLASWSIIACIIHRSFLCSLINSLLPDPSLVTFIAPVIAPWSIAPSISLLSISYLIFRLLSDPSVHRLHLMIINRTVGV